MTDARAAGSDAPRRSIARRVLTGWGTAVGQALAAALLGGAVAEALVFAAYGLSTRRSSALDVARAGGLLFAWFHRVGIELSAIAAGGTPKKGAAAPPSAPFATVTVGFAALLGTALVAWLLFRGGRAVAARGLGSAWERGLHGMKVAVPYALVTLGAAFGSRLERLHLPAPSGKLTSLPRLLTVHPAFVQAALWPLAIAAVLGFAGGVSTAPLPGHARRPATADRDHTYDPDAGRPTREERGRWARAALAGGWRMLLLGLAGAFAGLLAVAALRRSVTAAYFRGAFHGGLARGALLLALTALAVPNMAAWLLAAASGSCVRLSAGAASGCVLSYSRLPTGGGVLRSLSRLQPGTGSATFAAPARPYLLFLLVPAVAAVAGGLHAGRRARGPSRGIGCAVGAAAGLAFGAFAGFLAALARIVLDVASAGTPGGLAAASAVVAIGPSILVTALTTAAWGVVGGAVGGALARPDRGETSGASSPRTAGGRRTPGGPATQGMTGRQRPGKRGEPLWAAIANPTMSATSPAMPMNPSTIPAVAIPRPVCEPPERSMSRRAMNPKITASTDPIP